MSLRPPHVLLAGLALAVCSCGGGGGGAPLEPPGPERVELALGEFGHLTGAVVSANTADPSAGDTAANLERRALLRFNVASIPTSATILSAELRAEEAHVAGNVFTGLGGFALEAVNAGVVLDVAADFLGPALSGSPVLLPVPSGPSNSVRVVGVTFLLNAARQAGLVSLDLRLRPLLPSDNDGGDDLRTWNVLTPVAGVPPVLVVTYQP